MLNKISLTLQLTFLAILAMLLATVEASYCCCLQRFGANGDEFTSYCDNAVSERACTGAGLTWYPGFVGIGNGCDVGASDTKDIELRRKFFRFEDSCGGRETYKCY